MTTEYRCSSVAPLALSATAFYIIRMTANDLQIYLAMEEKEEKSDVKAATLIQSFQRAFYRMSFTVHPQNIPGEAQGKSSNESWAAKEACKEYPRVIQRNVVITTMDGMWLPRCCAV